MDSFPVPLFDSSLTSIKSCSRLALESRIAQDVFVTHFPLVLAATDDMALRLRSHCLRLFRVFRLLPLRLLTPSCWGENRGKMQWTTPHKMLLPINM